jgi:soluble lytic murein transglycosylase-like protein
MDISFIPGIGLLLIFLLSNPGNHPSQGTNSGYSKPVVAKAASQNHASKDRQSASEDRLSDGPIVANPIADSDPSISSSVPVDPEKEYRIIYGYIRKKFPKIAEHDARTIAKNLVESASEHDIDPKLTAALIARESGFNRKAVSSTGAKGLGQIKNFNFKSLNIKNPFSIQENANGTTQYVKEMLGNWKENSSQVRLALASYYKGYGAVKRDNGQLDTKTNSYVDDILKYYREISGSHDEN